ncbi:MAG TPA: hypothetical protein VFQ15_10050 [Jiangellaceae bacterium]|nr:hypothetical protein [Jiangellaceae bacterium]
MSLRPQARRPVLAASPFQAPAPPPPPEPFALNDMLTHDRHGLGKVVGKIGDYEIHVDFGSAVRRISLPNAKVTRL